MEGRKEGKLGGRSELGRYGRFVEKLFTLGQKCTKAEANARCWKICGEWGGKEHGRLVGTTRKTAGKEPPHSPIWRLKGVHPGGKADNDLKKGQGLAEKLSRKKRKKEGGKLRTHRKKKQGEDKCRLRGRKGCVIAPAA